MKTNAFFFAFFLLFFTGINVNSADYTVSGKVETVRKNNYVTIRFFERPDSDVYYIFTNNSIIGSVFLIKREEITDRHIYLAEFVTDNKEGAVFLRAGMSVISIKPDKSIDTRYNKKPYIERIEYKKEIISAIDKREMVLISSGKFLMGSAGGEKDEFPESIENLPDYYIDKYEVSNSDFKKFLDETAGNYPDYWKNNLGIDGEFTSEYFKDLPAIVTYKEASEYAAWCGKRLPQEKEWEKAARRPLDSDKKHMSDVYTWGYDSAEGISNNKEFWENDNTGKNLKETIKNEYKLEKLDKGYIPVKLHESASVSFHGAVHMDGNALEWTDSWYKAYADNHYRDKKFGTQYKVVRGGSYYLPAIKSRVTDRKIGGIPSLDKDRMAGFRCVKDVSLLDRLN